MRKFWLKTAEKLHKTKNQKKNAKKSEKFAKKINLTVDSFFITLYILIHRRTTQVERDRQKVV